MQQAVVDQLKGNHGAVVMFNPQTGDLLAMFEEMRPLDAALHGAIESPGIRALATLLDHPLAGDLVRYALTPDATHLRRRLGSTAPR